MPLEPKSDHMDLGVWGLTDTGRLRNENQDSFFALELASPPSPESVRLGPRSEVDQDEVCRCLPLGPRGALLLVADGMGGAAGGEIASRLAITSVVEAIERIWRGGGPTAPVEFAEKLRDAFFEAHARIQTYADQRPWLRGMGTTMTVAGVLNRSIVFAHVGDSRAYLLRREKLSQITRDQTWVQDMVDAGTMTPGQAKTSPRRSLLLQALGTTPGLSVPVSRCDLAPGDVLLLCSDGLSSVLDDQALASVLLEAPDLRQACQTLVDEANEAGGPDNITVLVAEPRARCPEGASIRRETSGIVERRL